MKITIDTKEDSREEIKKVISMLSALVGGSSPVYTNSPPKAAVANIFDSPGSMTAPGASSEPASGSVFGNIFGPVSSSSSDSASSGETITDSSDEEPEKKPQIQIIDY